MNRIGRYIFISLLVVVTSQSISAQQTVTFKAEDGLDVTADLYLMDLNYPYIILLHQAGYSRGEYREIAPRLTNLGYNCLAVDLRSGNEVNGVVNQTHQLAQGKGLKTDYIAAINDVDAAIAYVKSRTDKPFVLWGSSYSASLALIVGTNDLRTAAVVSFSPGEYFDDKDFVKNQIKRISVPVLVLSAKSECASVNELVSVVNPNLVTKYCPSEPGKHGAKALWSSSPFSDDYWLAVTMFFSKLKK